MKARSFFYLFCYSFVLLLTSVIFFPPTPAQAQWAAPRFNLKLVFYANYQQVWGDQKPGPNYTVKVQLTDRVKLTDGQDHELSCNTTPYGRTQVGSDELRGEVPREVLAATKTGQELLKNPYPWGACMINWPDKIYPYPYNSWTIENRNRWFDFQTKTTPRLFQYAIPVQTLSYAGQTAINPQTNPLTKCRKLQLAVTTAYGPAGPCQVGSQKFLGSYRTPASETTGSGGGTQTIFSETSQTASTIYVHYYFNLDPSQANEKAYPGAISPTKFRQNVVDYLDKKMNKIVNGQKIYHPQFFSTLMFLDGFPIIYVPDRPVYFAMVKPTERYKYMDSKLVRHYIPTAAHFLRKFEDGSLTIVNSGRIDAKTSADFYKKSGLKWLEFHRQLSNRGVNFLKSMQLPPWPGAWDLLLTEIPGL